MDLLNWFTCMIFSAILGFLYSATDRESSITLPFYMFMTIAMAIVGALIGGFISFVW